MDIQGDMQITLVIKAPNQRMEDQTVDCMLGWTIRKLKHHLESVYPSKPKLHEQRLIYSGKLLQDHLTLKEILKQYDSSNTHTVHLVCSNSSSPGISTANSTSQKAKDQKGSSNNETQPDTTDSSSDGLRYRGPNPQQNVPSSSSYSTFSSEQSPPFMTNPVPPPGCPYTPEQYAWYIQQQQAYSQYMMQYMQYYQQSMFNGGQPFMNGGMAPSLNPHNMPASPYTPLPQQQGQQQPQLQPVAGEGNNAQRGNNVRMNAQGGMEEDDEDERDPRDWLHHTYFIMRFITFVGIIVFYSSFSRFVIVMTGFLIIYFFQKMRIAREQSIRREQQERQQREEEVQQQQQQQQEENAAQADQPQDAQQDRNTTEENNSSPDDSNEATGEQEEEGATEEGNKIMRSLFFVLKTIESFFSSLVPAPPELEAN